MNFRGVTIADCWDCLFGETRRSTLVIRFPDRKRHPILLPLPSAAIRGSNLPS
ncbi:hypothetical protein BVRB_6g152250 [Beta vulgaris subsp. vulgaris]|nr:hypothetical protein BVRB_6g152250 [Beta vulgaris subsp. vulgaris]